MATNKATIRKHFLDCRKGLSSFNRTAQETVIAQHIINMAHYQQAQSVAVYLAMPGECSVDTIIENAIANDKTVVAPVVVNKAKRQMDFYPVIKQDKQWTIDKSKAAFNMSGCDFVITPLVAFDKQNNRIGMGAGFYDQLMADIAHDQNATKPYYCGVAYHEQEAEQLPCDDWDMPLDVIMTCQAID